MYLTKLESGLFMPSYPTDKAEADKVKIGEEIRGTRARNVKHHRKGFALLKLGFDSQDEYDNFDIYRQVISIKAGFVEWVKGRDGRNYPLPKSLSFEKMSQAEFTDWYNAVLTVISKEIKLSGPEIEAELASFF